MGDASRLSLHTKLVSKQAAEGQVADAMKALQAALKAAYGRELHMAVIALAPRADGAPGAELRVISSASPEVQGIMLSAAAGTLRNG